MSTRSISYLFVLSLCAASALAQVPVLERGEELARLEPLAGTWHGRLERTLAGGGRLVVEPVVTVDWDVGGVWLRAKDVTELLDGTVIENLTELTWNEAQGAYLGLWRDNVLAAPTTFRGTWLDEKRLELDTGEFTLGGRRHRVLLTYVLDSEDVHRTVMRQGWDGREPTVVAEGRFERVRTAMTTSHGSDPEAGTRGLRGAHLRVVRPTDDLEAMARFYREGLGFEVIGTFEDHDGYDGVMLGHEGAGYHLELVHHRGRPAGRAPTKENMLVFYLPDEVGWRAAIDRMEAHGYESVPSENPYWEKRGKTFEDPGGYRVVFQNGAWR